MDKTEKKILDSIALSTVVIGFGTLGIFAVEFLDKFESLLPMSTVRIILIIIGWTSLLLCALSLYKYSRIKQW